MLFCVTTDFVRREREEKKDRTESTVYCMRHNVDQFETMEGETTQVRESVIHRAQQTYP